MAAEIPLSPSQVRMDGLWRPIRHKTVPVLRIPPPASIPPRRSSLRAVLRRKPLSTICEDTTPSLKSNSTVSLRLNISVPYQPSVWPHSSEHLLYFHPSQQLQNFQSVSLHCTDEVYDSMPRMYRTQSQWTTQSSWLYELNNLPAYPNPMACEVDASNDLDHENRSEYETNPIVAEEDISREAIADLFHRVEEYEREHPEFVRDSGKVWVRVNSVGHGLTKTFKTMSSLRKKQTFEVRLGHSVPVQSQLKVYEKPSHMKRVKIAAYDGWRKFRNWSTGRDTELWARTNVVPHRYPFMNVSIVSLPLPEASATRPCPLPRRLSRARKLKETAHGKVSARKARKESKLSIGEQPKRRKSSLFLDV